MTSKAEMDLILELANLRSLMVYTLSACAHYQEYVDTGHSWDLVTAKDTLRVSPDLRKWIEENPALLPVRRDGKSFLGALE